MDRTTMAAGTLLIAAGLYDTYFESPESPMPYGGVISEIFLLSGGALLIYHARNGATLPEAIENVARSMINVKGT